MGRRISSALILCITFNIPIASGANAATISAPDISLPLPASWTMLLIGLGLGFVFYRLFSV